MPTDIYLNIAYVVVFATFVSYLLIPIGQIRLRPTVVSMYNYLQPIISSLVAVILGMDIFGWTKGVASLLVFLGVYIVTQSKSRAQIEAEKQK
jgi:drug/metabolite transporter (DMT)-like permease